MAGEEDNRLTTLAPTDKPEILTGSSWVVMT